MGCERFLGDDVLARCRRRLGEGTVLAVFRADHHGIGGIQKSVQRFVGRDSKARRTLVSTGCVVVPETDNLRLGRAT